MSKIFYAVAVALVCFGTQAFAAEGVVVRRSTLLVADIEKSIRFYEALGFTKWYDQGGARDPERPMTLPLNVKPGYSRLVIMKGRDPWIAMVGLLGYDKPTPPSNRIVADKIGAGDTILMMEIDDVKRAHDKLVAGGFRIIQPPKQFETKLADGTPIKGWNAFAVDPDGRVIELSQPTEGGR